MQKRYSLLSFKFNWVRPNQFKRFWRRNLSRQKNSYQNRFSHKTKADLDALVKSHFIPFVVVVAPVVVIAVVIVVTDSAVVAVIIVVAADVVAAVVCLLRLSKILNKQSELFAPTVNDNCHLVRCFIERRNYGKRLIQVSVMVRWKEVEEPPTPPRCCLNGQTKTKNILSLDNLALSFSLHFRRSTWSSFHSHYLSLSFLSHWYAYVMDRPSST